MAEVQLHIGGFAVRLEGADTLRRAMGLPGMAEFAVAGAGAPAGEGFEVHLDSVLQQPPCRLLHRFDIADGRLCCRFGVDAQGVYYYDFGSAGLLRYDLHAPRRVDIGPVADPSVLRFALWTAYAMAGLRQGAVPVHSSVVVCRGKAVMCLGESGTGKSTHTRLWLQHIAGSHLLNDDSPIVSLVGGEVRVHGSPWSGKTHCYRPESYPIAGFLRLEQRRENTIRRLGTVEAFAALQPSCPPALAREERCLDALVAFLSGVIAAVPVFRMGCLPDAAAARLSHQTLMP